MLLFFIVLFVFCILYSLLCVVACVLFLSPQFVWGSIFCVRACVWCGVRSLLFWRGVFVTVLSKCCFLCQVVLFAELFFGKFSYLCWAECFSTVLSNIAQLCCWVVMCIKMIHVWGFSASFFRRSCLCWAECCLWWDFGAEGGEFVGTISVFCVKMGNLWDTFLFLGHFVSNISLSGFFHWPHSSCLFFGFLDRFCSKLTLQVAKLFCKECFTIPHVRFAFHVV